MRNIRHPLIFIILLLYAGTSFGQSKALPINLSLFNQATALPFTSFFSTPVHPGIQIGTEFNYSTKAGSRFFQTANLSYFYHNYLAQGVGLSSELGYESRLKNGLAITGLLGLGYMHTFTTSEEFTFSDGTYHKQNDKGNSRLFPSLSLDLGYYLNPSRDSSPKVFVRYQSWAEYPYSPGFIPAMTHVNLHFGIKFFLHKNDHSHE
ncbi:hypothetical protein IFO69_18540 [Echinicola sp. CAU 1574]|uniref:Outer membrane protein beta-barrel domain-containing protein n=1 Tax=Echinicola arenosa TaxID=2774144 RepID=A0ABR9AQU3_9BACT|nr:hypothetical protein [Echinicola arenosa]MBD8490757.1 hypothetical protein [Echinicola arenosa]